VIREVFSPSSSSTALAQQQLIAETQAQGSARCGFLFEQLAQAVSSSVLRLVAQQLGGGERSGRRRRSTRSGVGVTYRRQKAGIAFAGFRPPQRRKPA